MTIGSMAAALLAVAAQAPASVVEQSVEALAWVSGDWEQATQSAPNVLDWTVERWSRPRAGVMLGTSLTGRRTTGDAASPSDRPRAYEFLRISPGEGGRLTYFASPGGQAAVAFPVTRMERYAAVFENPAHDYPQRIEYRWDGDLLGEKLTATISLSDGNRAMSWTYRRPRQISQP